MFNATCVFCNTLEQDIKLVDAPPQFTRLLLSRLDMGCSDPAMTMSLSADFPNLTVP